MKQNGIIGTATVLTLSIVLFYLPSIIFQIEKGEGAWEFDVVGIVLATFYTVTFCLNYIWLVPVTLLKKGNRYLYFGVNLCLIILTMLFVPFWLEIHGEFPDTPWRQQENISIWRYIAGYAGLSLREGIMVILAAGLAFATKMSREKENIRTRELELNAEHRQIELQSLKAQLNPHFLFNTLNNIYALIAISPERAQESLHTLSNMLRFMIYESSEMVELEKEAQFIKEYVELMKLRIGDSCRVEYKMTELPTGLRISPLLYLTLVENAFKHTASNGKDCFIRVSWEVRKMSRGKELKDILFFIVENTYKISDEGEDIYSQAGVGLDNVNRQLKLLYPDSYIFNVTGRKGIFVAEVGIKQEAMNVTEKTPNK
ncbi:MAG: sensor histidine kinase [Muribaculaceae bacterium]|nr:sensor histidine kinase [Muribaculaceae bacterium]